MAPPPSLLTCKVRCNSKNLTASTTGGAGQDYINVGMALVPQPHTIAASGSMNFTILLSGDVFQVGNYYDVTMNAGDPPPIEPQNSNKGW